MNQTDRSIHTSSQQAIDEYFMRRCLQLARNGRLMAVFLAKVLPLLMVVRMLKLMLLHRCALKMRACLLMLPSMFR